MTIKLRKETIERLEPEVARFIELSNVNQGNIVDVLGSWRVLWQAEEFLPKEGPKRQELDRYVGEHSLAAFMTDELRERLLALKYEPEKEAEPVLKALGLDDARPLARELLQALQELPRSYWATLPLPPRLASFVIRLSSVRSFGSAVRLVHDADEVKRVLPANAFGGLATNNALAPLATNLLAALLGQSPTEAALQVQVEGFVPRLGGGETVDEAHGMFKSFFGLAIAVDLFKTADFPQPQTTRLSIYFGQAEKAEGGPLATIPLSDAETTAISGLSYVGRSDRDRHDLTDAERRMSDMEVILSSPERHQLLLRACRWLFDSHVSEDPLLSFVQATVVMEILLGDKASSDEVGLSTLLANRCAYMIGATTSERDFIIKHFKALYGTRSKIVHSGKHRLSSSEQIQLHQLRAFGRKVICAEMQLAIEEIRRQQRREAAQSASRAMAAQLREDRS